MSYEGNENLNFAQHIPQVDALVVPPVGIEGEAEPLLPSSPLSANPTQLPGWDGAKLDAMRPFIVGGNPIRYEGLIGDVAKAGDPTIYDAMLARERRARESMVRIAKGDRLIKAQQALLTVEGDTRAKQNEAVLEKTTVYQEYVRSATEAAAAVYDANPALGRDAETLARNVAEFSQIVRRQVGAAALLKRVGDYATQVSASSGTPRRYADEPKLVLGTVMDMIMPSREVERDQGVRRGYPITLGQHALKNTPEVISLIELCEATESDLARSGNQPATAELDAIRGLAQCVLEAFTTDAEAFKQNLAQQAV